MAPRDASGAADAPTRGPADALPGDATSLSDATPLGDAGERDGSSLPKADAAADATNDARSDVGTGTDASKNASDATADVSADGRTTSDGGATKALQWVTAYYVGYDINAYPMAQIDWTGLTHIVFAPLVLKSNLSLDTSFDDQNGTGPADATALAVAAHAHGVKALLGLGGAGNGSLIATAASAPNRAQLVTNLLSAVDTFGYDGIDIDWEDSVSLPDFVALASALRSARADLVLTYPAPAVNGNLGTVDPQYVSLASSLDQMNAQTYSPSTTGTGQGWDSWFSSPVSGVAGATPIAIDDTLQRYVAAGVPKGKLGLSLAFFAICYSGGITGPRQPLTSQQLLGGEDVYPLSAFFASGSTFDRSTAAEQKRDNVAQVPFLSLVTAVNDEGCGASTQYISYEDETSIVAKGTFSKANGYGGTAVVPLNGGRLPAGASGGRAPNALTQALKSGFLEP